MSPGQRSTKGFDEKLKTQRSRRNATFFLAEIHYPVVKAGDEITDQESGNESVDESDQASQKGYPIANEELAEEREMRPDDRLPMRTDRTSF
jgi:hypothetical protein